MTTAAQTFKNIAKRILPAHDDLQDLDDTIDNWNHIDEIMFHKGEYLGGMATAIISIAMSEKI